MKFCLVAEGSADIYPRFGPTMEWDTAAGDAVLRAARPNVAEHDARINDDARTRIVDRVDRHGKLKRRRKLPFRVDNTIRRTNVRRPSQHRDRRRNAQRQKCNPTNGTAGRFVHGIGIGIRDSGKEW